MLKCKKRLTGLFVAAISILCCVGHSFAQVPPTRSAGVNDLADVLGFNLGVVPDNTGNLSMETGFDFNYGRLIGVNWLSLGASYTKTDTTQTNESQKGQIKEVTNVKQEIIRLQPIALKFDFGTFMTVKPGANAQLLSQKKKYNLTDRTTDTFGNEESKLRSVQFNGQLETWFYFGPVTAYLTGSFNPLSMNDETALGYDSIYISEKDSQGNVTYEGYTGDYSFNTSTQSSYYDAKFYLDIKDVVLGSDLYLSGKYVYLSYDYTTQYSMIYNGTLETYKEKKSFEKTDITGTLGLELAFLDLGQARPLATFNYTYSKMPKGTEHIVGAGILLLQ